MPDINDVNVARNRFDDFSAVDSTLSDLNFTGQMKFALYKLLACILHLGNIEFQKNADGNVTFANNSSKIGFELCAELLQTEPQTLKNALFHRRFGVKDIVMQVFILCLI